jgi:adenylate cyclase class 2
MLEIEIKARIKSPKEIEKAIINQGGSFRMEVTEEDIYFSHPNRNFAKTDEALRLRAVEGKFYLTYKGPKLDKITKTREEFNIQVNDLENSNKILKSLGFEVVLPVKKKRRYLRLGAFDIMLDFVDGLGSFIEVEKKGEYNPQELIDFLAGLGIYESETKSYLELALEKK